MLLFSSISYYQILMKDMKYTIEVAPKSIQRYKDLEVAYKSVLDLYIQQQDDLKALEKEEE